MKIYNTPSVTSTLDPNGETMSFPTREAALGCATYVDSLLNGKVDDVGDRLYVDVTVGRIPGAFTSEKNPNEWLVELTSEGAVTRYLADPEPA